MIEIPPDLAGRFELFLGCRLPWNVMLMHCLIEAGTPAEVDLLISAAHRRWPDRGERLSKLEAEWRERPQAWTLVRQVIDAVPHAQDSSYPDLFARVASLAPDAASALYALGDDRLLGAATREVADWITDVLDTLQAATVLDLGCGSGRLTASLAASAGFVLGLDVAGSMLQAARRRLQRTQNAGLVAFDGADLACLADARFDLVVAADVFPYIRDRGAMLREIARVLGPGGACLVLNAGYEHGAGANLLDRAAEAGLAVFPLDQPCFGLWDAECFAFRRASRNGD